MEQLLKPKEVARIVGICPASAWHLIVEGDIPSVIVGRGTQRRSFRVRPSDLEKWLKAREMRNVRPACPESTIAAQAAL